jgi:hypothetical protein
MGNGMGTFTYVAKRRVSSEAFGGGKESEADPPPVPEGLGPIQNDWLRVADVLHTYEGQHQARRGGPSIGKAITLVATNAKSWGTGTATLWKNWSTYKDVAHLVTAATLICAEARAWCCNKQLGPFGLSLNQFIPFQMAMLMPDLVLAVALEFERLGLSVVPHGRTEPTLDPQTVWRIPPEFWFTSIYHMDDPEELNFGFNVARDLFKEATERSKGLARKFCRELGQEGELEKVKEVIAFYSVSFGLRDVGQQWTDYADKGRGVAFGLAPKFFRPARFEDPGNPKPEEEIFYGNVSYGPTDGRARDTPRSLTRHWPSSSTRGSCRCLPRRPSGIRR